MSTRISPAVATNLRQLLPAALLGVAVTLCGGAISQPAIVSAAPADDPEWDIEKYDQCMRISYNRAQCCIESGGVMIPPNAGGVCHAPPIGGAGPAGVLPGPPDQPAPPEVMQDPRFTPPQRAATQAPRRS